MTVAAVAGRRRRRYSRRRRLRCRRRRPRPGRRTPLPQVAFELQVALQPSPLRSGCRRRSSRPASRTPLPQRSRDLQVAEQPSPATRVAVVAALAATSTMPLPQVSSELAASRCSRRRCRDCRRRRPRPGRRRLLPQNSETQAAEQPSPPTLLPSSQLSPRDRRRRCRTSRSSVQVARAAVAGDACCRRRRPRPRSSTPLPQSSETCRSREQPSPPTDVAVVAALARIDDAVAAGLVRACRSPSSRRREVVLPSSQTLARSRATPLPQDSPWQVAEQPSPRWCCRRRTSRRRLTTPLPHTSVDAQLAEQPSPLRRDCRRRRSRPGSTTAVAAELRDAGRRAAVAAHRVAVVAAARPRSTTPLPQVSSGLAVRRAAVAATRVAVVADLAADRRDAVAAELAAGRWREQPSPPMVLPSSQASPTSTTPLPHTSADVQVARAAVAATPCCRRRRSRPRSTMPLPQNCDDAGGASSRRR